MKRLALLLSLLFVITPINLAHAKSSPSTTPQIGIGGRFVYKYVNGKLQRKNLDGKWYQTDSRTSKEFSSIRIKAFNNYLKSLETQTVGSFVVTEFVGRNYPKPILEAVRLQIKQVNAIASKYLDANVPIDVLLVTEKDASYGLENAPRITGWPKQQLKSIKMLERYKDRNFFYSTSGTGGGEASFNSGTGRGWYLGNTASYMTLETYWPQVVPHELTHILQMYSTRNSQNYGGEGTPDGKWAAHLIEGSANTFGMLIGYSILGWYSDEIDRSLQKDIKQFKNWKTMNTTSDAVKMIEAVETRQTEESGSFCYSVGSFLWEYYIATYGVSSYFDLLKNMAVTANLDENFRKTIGISKSDFYRDAAPYILASWKRLTA